MLGIFKDLSNDDYHADTSAVSRSGLMKFRQSPAHYWNAYVNPVRPPKEETEAMIFGNAFHTFLLEPDKFDSQYAFLPPFIDRRTKEGKAIYEDFTTKNQGKKILTVKHQEMLQAMGESVWRNPQAKDLIQGALYEHSLFWQDEHSGVHCKTRPDIWHSNMTVDIKTISSADESTFQRAIVSHGYHIQAAMNREGIRETGGDDIKTHVFICIEKDFPFLSAVYILDLATIDYAYMQLKNTLLEFKECLLTNTWPGYQTKTVGLPNWAIT